MNVWLHRAILAGLVLLAYLWAWTPARSVWITQGAQFLGTATSNNVSTIIARPEAPTIRVELADGQTAKHTAPAGIKFLLPALFLVLISPRRPHLGTFFAGHLALGVLALILFTTCTADAYGSLAAAGLVESYVVDAYSLPLPVLVFFCNDRTENG